MVGDIHFHEKSSPLVLRDRQWDGGSVRKSSEYLSVERLPLEDLPPGGLVVDVVDADDVRHVVLTQVVVLPPKIVMMNQSLITFLN